MTYISDELRLVLAVLSFGWFALAALGLWRIAHHRRCDSQWHHAMAFLALVFAIEAGVSVQPFWVIVWVAWSLLHLHFAQLRTVTA